MTTRAIPILALLPLLVASSAAAEGSGRLEYEMRRVQVEAAGEPVQAQAPDLFADRVGRIRHGAFSLLLPGWSQYRSGHRSRAIAFASAEAIIWGTWIFSEAQGGYRADRYEEFAQRFAGVGGAGHADEYWRAVGLYRSSEDYNVAVRRENRLLIEEQIRNGQTVTVGLEDGTVVGADAWEWSSDRRKQEYGRLRADSLSAYDRADLVLLFALVNRVVAFADAVRSGPPSEGDADLSLLRAGSLELGVDVSPPTGRGAALVLGGRF